MVIIHKKTENSNLLTILSNLNNLFQYTYITSQGNRVVFSFKSDFTRYIRT